MNRRTQFVTIVQTGIDMVMHTNPRDWDFIAVIARAVEIPEEFIPSDVERAAREFLTRSFGGGRVCQPEWLQAWEENNEIA